jgi:polyhydroxyalkanoate synthesis regulator phasin
MGIFRDITERKKAREEIDNRIRELEEFYEMAVGRELKMKELKEEMEKLREEVKELRSRVEMS